MKRDSMVVYREWKEALADLTPEEKCAAWEAIMDYAFDGTVPENKFLKVVTAMMRTRIDKDQSHYDQTCTKRAEAGRLGGLKSGETRSKRKQNEAKEANGSNASSDEANGSFDSSNEANEPDGSKRKQNEHDNDNDNDIDIDILTSLREDEYIRACEINLSKWMSRNQISLDSYCKNERMTPEAFKKYALAVFSEWRLAGWKSAIFESGAGEHTPMHLLNTVRIKNNANKKNNQNEFSQQDRFQRRRSTDADAWTEKKFEESF